MQNSPRLSSSTILKRNALARRRPLHKKMLDTLVITPLREGLIALKINFAPSCVPLQRRLQVLLTASWMFMMLVIPAFFIFLCSIPALWPFISIYLIWAYLIDDCTERGGRPSDRFRSLKLWSYIVEYFSVSLIKEADLPPDRPYVFGYHPHGLFAFGAQATFGTNLTGFSTAFPGIRPHLLTLTINLALPIYREILIKLGGSTASRQSCCNILQKGPGEAIALVVGGAEESLSARPGVADLVLKKRLGFIKIAIQNGAGLVPCFGFGENDLFNQMANEKGSRIHNFQKKFKSLFGFASPFVHGRGLLNYNFGLVPFRKPLRVVIGRPIQVNQMDKPSPEEISRVQKLYFEELTRIWDTYKDKYASNRIRELRIIE